MRRSQTRTTRSRSRRGAIVSSTLGLVLALPVLVGSIGLSRSLGAEEAATRCSRSVTGALEGTAPTLVEVCDPELWRDAYARWRGEMPRRR